MLADSNGITSYHLRIAAQHHALAQAAREGGDFDQAKYHSEIAARYADAAQAQRKWLSQTPGQPTEQHRVRRRPPEPKPRSTGRLLTVLRGAGRIAAAIHHSIAKRNDAFTSLSLD
ncbi:MAG: hypothetical protein ABR907_13455 [Terracidiphilus sp.]|jgi:hypothetical protein